MSDEAINNDELALFVTSTLNAIATGVSKASSGHFSFIVPSKISFEVAVKATKGTEAGGGLKLQVFNAEGKKTAHDEEVSRITFDVASNDERPSVPINYGNRKRV